VQLKPLYGVVWTRPGATQARTKVYIVNMITKMKKIKTIIFGSKKRKTYFNYQRNEDKQIYSYLNYQEMKKTKKFVPQPLKERTKTNAFIPQLSRDEE
jgi:hypothetical protein